MTAEALGVRLTMADIEQTTVSLGIFIVYLCMYLPDNYCTYVYVYVGVLILHFTEVHLYVCTFTPVL